MADTSKVANKLFDDVQKATEPSRMSKKQALEVLDELKSLIEASMESLEEEILEDEG